MKSLLQKLYRGWMAFAHVLGWVNGRIILTALYVVVLGPYAVVRRFFSLFSRAPSSATYWRLRGQEKQTLETFRRIF